jgi:hypothetical protein
VTAGTVTACAAYADVKGLLADPAMASAATAGLTILYGPQIQRPDLMMISFEDGGADGRFQLTWPDRLLYLYDEAKSGNAFKFGRTLCACANEAGVCDPLASSCVATCAIFPQATEADAGRWLTGGPPWADWRAFWTGWVRRFVAAFAPRVIVVFGDKASRALGLAERWPDVARNHGQGWMTFGRTDWLGVPTLFTTHLSRTVLRDAVRALATARGLVA